jgi:hypothetical protein
MLESGFRQVDNGAGSLAYGDTPLDLAWLRVLILRRLGVD